MSLRRDLPEPDDEDDADNDRSYEAFDRQYGGDHSWDQLQEENGRLRPLDDTAELRARRARILAAAQSARIRKGMIRYLVLVVDMSRAADAQDLRPNRLAVMAGAARSFIRSYFDQNPLSYLSVLLMRGGVAVKLTELGGSPERQIQELRQALEAEGDASIQNALEVSVDSLGSVPPYGAKQVLMLVAALSTVDASDVYAAIRRAKDAKVVVSVVGVAAEVHVLRRAAEETGGSYGVALNEQHLLELLLAHAPPPPATSGQLAADLVRMGFPQQAPQEAAAQVFVGEMPELASGGYTCPRCKARASELPCRCHVCGLTLISSPHLARSYHHLLPVHPYEEVGPEELEQLAAAAAAAAGAEPSGGGPRSAVGTAGRPPPGAAADQGRSSSSGVGSAGGRGSSSRRWLLPPWEEDTVEGVDAAITATSAAAAAAAGDGGGLRATAALDGALPSGSSGGARLLCYGCLAPLTAGSSSGCTSSVAEGGAEAGRVAAMVLRCTRCQQLFCFGCDVFVHEVLHNCPGCECVPLLLDVSSATAGQRQPQQQPPGRVEA